MNVKIVTFKDAKAITISQEQVNIIVHHLETSEKDFVAFKDSNEDVTLVINLSEIVNIK